MFLLAEALLDYLQGHTRHQLSYKPEVRSIAITVPGNQFIVVSHEYLFLTFYMNCIATLTQPSPDNQVYYEHSWSYDDPELLDRLLEELAQWD